MKKLLEVNETDNVFTAFAKGGAKGMISSVIGVGALVATSAIIGTIIKNNDESTGGETLETDGLAEDLLSGVNEEI